MRKVWSSHCILLLWSLAVFFLSSVSQGQECKEVGWFGTNCQYKCHCTANKCDSTTGDCVDNSVCLRGWFGPQCQYVDLTTTLRYTYNRPPPTWIDDGYDTTCNQNESVQAAGVALQNPVPFTWLRLLGNDQDALKAIQVGFKMDLDNDYTNLKDCNNIRTATVGNTSLDIHCELDSLVQQVILFGAGVKSLCSLYISGGRNVALKQNTSQSPSLGNLIDTSSRAVDGNIYTSSENCARTPNVYSPRWSVTFDQPQAVNNITIHYFQNQNYRYTVTLDDHEGSKLSQGQSYVATSEVTDSILKAKPVAPVSKISITTTYNVRTSLTLCQVQVSGDTVCPQDKYGRECEHSCDNCVNQTCFVSTGACPFGCLPGFIGDQCQTPCLPTYTGQDCKERCSSNCVDQICDNVNGTCDLCPAGKTGDICEEDCPPKTFGSNCEMCSINCTDQLCDAVSGFCNKCPATKYGQNCEMSCSTDCVDQLCDSESGGCNTCPPGYSGDTCEKPCQSNTYGQDCLQTCSTNCARNEAVKFEMCNHVNGSCILGCLDGFLEPLCEDRDETAAEQGGDSSSSSFPIFAVVGAGAAVVLIIAIIIAVLLLRRRRRSKREESPRVNGDTPISAYINNRPTTIGETPYGASPYETIQETAVSVTQEQRQPAPREGTPAARVTPVGLAKPYSPNPYETIQEEDIAARRDQKSDARDSKPVAAVKPVVKLENDTKSEDPSSTDPSTYYNTAAKAPTSTRIPVKDLGSFIKSHSKQFFRGQFDAIPNNDKATTSVAESKENMPKNRYKNICAYDHSRVPLQPVKDKKKKHGDYINASYLKGYKGMEMFIASQGPTKIMMEDFVRMLWEQRVEKVVMLTNLVEEGKVKCERYWPEEGDMQVGDIKVRLTTTDVIADYTIRRLQLSKPDEQTLHLTQFHFTSWPDKDVPTTPWGLVDFEQRVASQPTDKPIIVHCSAGVGRTGTFIALRNLMREAEDTGSVDVFTTVQNLREDRINMVQTPGQYEFLHRAAQVAILCTGTTVTSADIENRIAALHTTNGSGKLQIEEEFEAINEICASNDSATAAAAASHGTAPYEDTRIFLNRLKDRDRNVPANDEYRPRLRCESDDNTGSYINTVFVPSFRKQNNQFLTQLPLTTTVTDFWRLVTQYKVSLVVTFDYDIKNSDLTIGDHLPARAEDTLELPQFKIKEVPKSSEWGIWKESRVIVTGQGKEGDPNSQEGQENKQEVKHLLGIIRDKGPADILRLVEKIRSINHGGLDRTLYMCRNGATSSGLVCVLTLLLDRMDHDLRLTVPLVVGAIKAIRPQVIPTLEQYKQLYTLLQHHRESSNEYSNFGDSTHSLGASINTEREGAGDVDNRTSGAAYANTVALV